MTTAYVYQSLSEVPTVWRKLKGGRLALEQINAIVSRAYALGSKDAPAYGKAQAEFMAAHELRNGLWVRK